MEQVFQPSGKLPHKYILRVLLALAPGLGWVFVIIYLLANALWVIVAVVLIPPYCKTISYHLGEDELVVRRGLVTRAEDTVPYAMITNIGVRRSPLDRLLGLGSLAVHTAGFSGQSSAPEAKLVGLEDWGAVQVAILDAARKSRRHEEPPVSALGSEDETALLKEMLQEIRGLRADLRSR